ncbi:hypothetical protein C8Q79DRAFT_947804 [Trametes meyenii]|nr:hypothetical protein C8Q79DRAFT_947804 [Trametes meyenii]
MPFLDTIQNAALKVLPEKKSALPMPASTTGGIGSAGVVPFEDDVSYSCFSRLLSASVRHVSVIRGHAG